MSSGGFTAQGGSATNCNIPPNPVAVVVNITAVSPAGAGNFIVFPTGTPTFTSVLNYNASVSALANGAIVPVCQPNCTNQLTVATNGAGADVIVDIVGYFKPPGDATGLNVLVGGQRVMRYAANAASPDLIGGDPSNLVLAGAAGGTVAGGGAPGASVGIAGQPVLVCDPFGGVPQVCANRVYDAWGVVAGGVGNVAGNNTGAVDDAPFASVGGGRANAATSTYSTVAGGERNIASGPRSVVAGGNNNVASNNKSAVAGGEINTAAGFASIVAGGSNNRASGDYSYAAGRRAKTQTAGGTPHNGAFVWADSGNFDFNSAAVNEFAARATGGVRFVTAIDGNGVPTNSVSFDTNGNLFTTGSVNPPSDVALKTAFGDVSVRDVLMRVLSMPVRSWAYKATPDVRHVGPTAQDFYAAFGLGIDDRHIATVDADGVALAAIQGLNAKVEEQQRELADLRERFNAAESVRAELAIVKAMLAELQRSHPAVAAQ